MNFLVTPDGPGRSVVSTETRVFANSPSARRRFAAYWRVIYPGSAIIRRMWLRAIERRAISRKDLAMGPSGWVGVWLDGKVNWTKVDEILRDGYQLVAPKRLIALLGDT